MPTLPAVPSHSPPPVTLAELVATLSLVADLGMARPMERVLRQTVVAMRLGTAAGVDEPVRSAAYYTSLLTWVGCAADTSELAELFGDETELYADSHDGDLAGVTMAVFIARHLGRGSSGLRRLGLVGAFLASAGRSVQQVMESHCQSAGELAHRLDLGEDVRQPLLQAFERWDGRGVPGKVAASDLAPAIRLVHLADSIEAFHHSGGAAAALEVARARRGTQFDPTLVDCFADHHDEILDGLDEVAVGTACDGCPDLPSLVTRFEAAGGEILVCPICFNSKGLDAGSLVANATLGGTVQLWEWIGDEAASCFSY